MDALKSANLVLRFLLELAGLAALGYWGFHTGKTTWVQVSLGVGAPLLAAVLWVTFVAPDSWVSVSEPLRLAMELLVFGSAVAALFAVGHSTLALWLAAIIMINRTLMFVLDQ